jgi:sugar phosphate permease
MSTSRQDGQNTGGKRLRKWQVRIFASTWLAYVGYYFCRKAFYVVKADMERVLHLAPPDIGHIGTAYLICYMIGQFSSAYVGRRLGPKLLLLVGMALSLVCNVVFGLSNGFWTVLLFMALNGLAQGSGWPGCIGSLAYWFKRKQRGSVLGVWATCYQIGSIAATSFAAFLLGAVGWRGSFFGAAAVLLAIWFVVLLLHPNRPENVGLEPVKDDDDEAGPHEAGPHEAEPVKDDDDEAGPHEAGPHEAEPVKDDDDEAGLDEAGLDEDRLGDPRPDGRGGAQAEKRGGRLGWSRQVVATILLMGAIYFCIKFLRYALWSWSAYFLRKNYGLAGDEAGYLTVVFDACGFGGVLFAGFVSDKIFKGRRAALSFFMLSFMFVGFLLIYLYAAASLAVFGVCLGVVGFGLYGPDSLLSGVGAIDVGSKKGALAAAGIINGMGSIGPVFQEQAVGWLYARFDRDLDPIFFLLMAVAAVGAVFTLFLWIKARMGKARI